MWRSSRADSGNSTCSARTSWRPNIQSTLNISISATTRQPREGETDGVEYFFKETKEFEQMIADGELLEYAQYVDNYYGTPKAYVEKQLADGKDVILEIEIQGALKIKEKFPDTVLMFVTAPNANELKNRLVGRGTETPEVIAARLSRACEESMGMEKYDYLVINDTIENGISLIDRLICDERSGNKENNRAHRVSANIDFINKMREELSGFSKGE